MPRDTSHTSAKNKSAQKVLHPLHSGVNLYERNWNFRPLWLFRCNLLPQLSQKQFIPMCCWGMSTKISAARVLSHGRRSELELVSLYEFECTCVSMCVAVLVQSQHSTIHVIWGPPSHSQQQNATDIPLISLKNGLSECNSCCTFGPYLDLPWLCKADLVLLLNFIIFSFQSAFAYTGLSHFQVYNMSSSYLTVIIES